MRSYGRARFAVVIGAVTALLLGAAPVSAAPQPSGAERIDVIVVFVDGIQDSRAAARDVARDHDARVSHVYDHALEGFSASIPVQRRQGLEADRRVASVQDDRPMQAFDHDDVPTGVSRIDAPDAHADATGFGVRVAVIDTGIDSDHEDLVGNLDTTGSGYDCINADTDPEDDNGHGTHVAGTIAAEHNGTGVIGVAPQATLVGIKVLDKNGSGSWKSVICGIDRIAELNSDPGDANDIHVANMSLGGSGGLDADEDCTNTGDALYAAICGAIDSGAAFTVAAGNDSSDASGFVPAAYREVITVSALQDANGDETSACTGNGPFGWCGEELASFSNYGEVVDVIAPGRDIVSTTYDGSYGTKSGTSMAAPHVAGVAALVLQDRDLTPADLVTHLRDTGQCPDEGQNDTGDCAGEWVADPDGVAEPMANAVWAVGSTTDGTTNSAPTASFTYSCVDLACDFDGSGSIDPDGDALTYDWDFGDDSTGSGTTVSHTYGAGGTYTVTLTVTDDEGAAGSESQDVSVSDSSDTDTNSAPTASFTHSCTGSSCDFNGTDSSDPDGDTLTYSWDFGDGTTGSGVDPLPHEYTSNGNHEVVLTVTDSSGASDSATGKVKCTGKHISCN